MDFSLKAREWEGTGLEDLGPSPGSGTHQLYNFGADYTFSVIPCLLPRPIYPLEIVTVERDAIYSRASEL